MISLLLHLADSTLIAAALALAIRRLPRHRVSAQTRHALWLLAFAKFAVPSSLLWRAGVSLGTMLVLRPPLPLPIAGFSRLLTRTSDQTTVAASASSHEWLLILVVCGWASGIVFLSWRWIHSLRRAAIALSPATEYLQSAFLRAKKQLFSRGTVAVAISKDAVEPVLIGVWRPVVVVPESLLGKLSAGELDIVLIHELAHAARRDNLTGSLAHSISILFWFHPLLSWMERQLAAECEFACDEIALRAAKESYDYASAISKTARLALSLPLAGISGIGGPELKKRLELIMSYSKKTSPRNKPRLVATAAAAVILIPAVGGLASTSLLRAQTLEKRQGIQFVSATASASTPQTRQILSELKALVNPNEAVFPASANDTWDKWLNGDVVYLITPAERATFLGLTSDAERQQFVEQFWERRNPTPGGTPNAFKEQYYRRIAYANDHFKWNDSPGWQTDRGRVYIVLGPPDEIDSHPGQHEEWRYNLRGSSDYITMSFDISGTSRP